jgi:hypothetical protein
MYRIGSGVSRHRRLELAQLLRVFGWVTGDALDHVAVNFGLAPKIVGVA